MGHFSSQRHAEDLVLWHRLHYYVLGCPLLTDGEYDALERAVRAEYPVSVADTVGSDNLNDYPEYIQQGRRPQPHEREMRDKEIAERYMQLL